jgi:hypothetical protein
MTTPDYEKKIDELSAKVHWLILGYKIAATCLLLFFSLLALGAALSIPHFQQIFMDALGPDHPFPSLTNCVLSCKSFLPILAVLWPVLGIVSIWASRKLYITVTVPIFLVIVIYAQFILTVIGLYLPMVTLVNGMADTPPTH